MAIITLLTDFGTKDAYVGVLKGVILSINPSATVVDISHDIDPQDIIQAAYLINASYFYFPLNTVHMVVVDPGVGSNRGIVAAKVDGHIFVAPDNGVLSLILGHAEVEILVKVEKPEIFLNTISHTFHGRDIFAPVAAHLSKGLDIEGLGSIVSPENLVEIDIHEPQVMVNGNLSGSIISIDRFGNLITNIHQKTLENSFSGTPQKALVFEINDGLIDGLSDYYENAPKNVGLALIGSQGYLEISVNCGDARLHYNAKKGDAVNVFVKQ